MVFGLTKIRPSIGASVIGLIAGAVPNASVWAQSANEKPAEQISDQKPATPQAKVKTTVPGKAAQGANKKRNPDKKPKTPNAKVKPAKPGKAAKDAGKKKNPDDPSTPPSDDAQADDASLDDKDKKKKPVQATQKKRKRKTAITSKPNSVSASLDETEDVTKDALFSSNLLGPLYSAWRKLANKIEQKTGLALGLNHTMLGQHASKALPGTKKNASSGDVDFFGQWPLLNVDKAWTGNISFAAEGRYKIGKLTPNELGASIGSLWKTTSGFNVQKFSLIEFYWEQGSAEDGGGYRIGKMKPADIYDGYRFASSNTSFLSRSYSHTMAMSVPSSGLGAVGGLVTPDNFYVLAGIHDANADKISIGHIDRGEFFYALELGAKPGNGKPGAGNYHATLWHKDKRDKAGIPSGYGVAFTAEQEFGSKSNISGFLRYSYGHRAGLDVRQTVSAGVVFDEVWGRNSDIIGLAATWGQPANRSMRDQYSVEGYYRIQLTPDAHITPDLQLIFDPSLTTMFNTVVVGSLRLRMVF